MYIDSWNPSVRHDGKHATSMVEAGTVGLCFRVLDGSTITMRVTKHGPNDIGEDFFGIIHDFLPAGYQ